MSGGRPWYMVLYPSDHRDPDRNCGRLFIPDTGKALRPLGGGFIELVKMMIAPVSFWAVVDGIASMSDLKNGKASPIRPSRIG